MRGIFYAAAMLIAAFSISGCKLLCQAGTGTCGMSSAERKRLLNPKAYGEYFVKPDISLEEWRRDWIDCGGMTDGGYSSDAPSGSTTEILIDAAKQKKKILSDCMQSKGYEHLPGFGKPGS